MERADAAAAIGHAQSYLISVHRPGGAYFIASDGTEDFLQITRELRTNTTLIKTSDFVKEMFFLILIPYLINFSIQIHPYYFSARARPPSSQTITPHSTRLQRAANSCKR